MLMSKVSLDDKYNLNEGTAFMSGIQALVRLPIVQRRRDIAAGLNTAGFISGYRGSPLGDYDRSLTKAKPLLDDYKVHFQPGLNEELAATAVWGSQQTNMFEGAKYDGVFGIWYGKGPGVDRSCDVFRHANAAGTSPKGGVLLIGGDDHACKSSTLPHQCDHTYYSLMMPMLYPASIQEFVEYGLLGIAMSRYSGCWTAFKVTSDTVEASSSVDLSRELRDIVFPTAEEFEMPPGGVHIRPNDDWKEQDWRLQRYKVFAALAFARKNNIDRTVWDCPNPRFGIITSGKSYADVRQALSELGITEEVAASIGLRLYKVGMPWPLEMEGVRHFAEGLEEVLVVEEKRELIENQIKQHLFNWRADVRPQVVGKVDEHGEWLLPPENSLSVGQIAHVIAERIHRFYRTERIEERLAYYTQREEQQRTYSSPLTRKPYFCSGCPHNSSTKVPEGSRATAGIGCHIMATWMDRNTSTFTAMGGEGVPWVGQAPFTETDHIFANLGDGTYFHSGILAIRQAIAAGVNITYKILFNDAVAMTGGQPHDGQLTVPALAQQMLAEGAKKVTILTEDMDRYPDRSQIPAGVALLDRDELESVQKQMRETKGCTVIIYDQTCAAEKRRRRKRGLFPDPDKRVFINDLVCEGCGDCSVQSNCVSVEPLETEFGRKRAINQSSCNKDFSCVKGFCPSFVSVHGATPRKTRAQGFDALLENIPQPQVPALDAPYNILVTGIGGTGVVTISALLGMAAHIEGQACLLQDQTGLAQKGGAVLSHIRLGPDREELRAAQICTGDANLLLACDLVVAAGEAAIDLIHPEHTTAIINGHRAPVSQFVHSRDIDFQEAALKEVLLRNVKRDKADFIEATALATALMGDTIATNIFVLGYAFQKGLIPLSQESIEEAIRLNGVAIEANLKTFACGRLAAHDMAAVEEVVRPILSASALERNAGEKIAEDLDEIIAKRIEFLTGYQNEAYAKRYEDLVQSVRIAEAGALPGREKLTEAVARNAFKLMAYKDEYEVARLYSDGRFQEKLKAQFSGDYSLRFHLSPPIFARHDEATGRPKKYEFGPWMLGAMKLLAKGKVLRGTALDIFGRSEERRMERALIEEYVQSVGLILDHLNAANYELCLELAKLPDQIRGFGPVKQAAVEKAWARRAELHELLKTKQAPTDASEPAQAAE